MTREREIIGRLYVGLKMLMDEMDVESAVLKIKVKTPDGGDLVLGEVDLGEALRQGLAWIDEHDAK